MFNRVIRIAGWLGINTVLGTMNGLLISFYSPEPFARVFLTAQIMTHVLCLLIEFAMFTAGIQLYRIGTHKKQPVRYFTAALCITAISAVCGVLAGGRIHQELLGFNPYENSRFYNVIFGSIIFAIGLASIDRFFRYLRETRLLAERSLQEARLAVLQERMRPHFLFNTLNSIHAMLPDHADRADAAILMLADSYRFLLGPAEKPLVSFSEEWDFCKNYVELMKVRFGERLSVWMELKGDFSRVLIPPLSIQPVIENAFRHGVQKIPGNAIVQVSAACSGSSVRIEVKDNGPGLPSDFESRSIDNIRSRLRFHFPGADLEVSNLGESGVSSRITLTGAT